MRVAPKLDALTGLRFFAAFAIVIHHSRGTFVTADRLSDWPLGSAVSFFFVLSGFILTHVYPELPTRKHVGRFLLARFARIWPIHLLSLFLSLVLISGLLKGNLALIANIAAVHAWIPRGDYFFSFNAVSWSISVEVGFYLLFPFLIYNFRSTWAWKLALSLLPAIALIALCIVLDPPPFDSEHTGLTSTGLLYTNPLARLFEFTLGMSAALWWNNYRNRIDQTKAMMWTLIEVMSIAALATYIAYVHVPAFGFFAPLLPGNLTIWLGLVDTSVVFALVIVVSASGAGWVSRALASPPLVFLGEISYSIYMLHQIMIVFLARHGLISWIPDEWQFVTLVALIVALSAISYLLVERPMRGAIVRLASRRVEPSYGGEGATLTEYCVPNPAALGIKNRVHFTPAVTELNTSSDSDRLSRA
jgi:peptidoglycan/LPS O-acetylase OafA/YrhL